MNSLTCSLAAIRHRLRKMLNSRERCDDERTFFQTKIYRIAFLEKGYVMLWLNHVGDLTPLSISSQLLSISNLSTVFLSQKPLLLSVFMTSSNTQLSQFLHISLKPLGVIDVGKLDSQSWWLSHPFHVLLEPNRTKPNRTEPNRTDPFRTGPITKNLEIVNRNSQN